MLNRELLLKIAPTLRKIKSFLIGVKGRVALTVRGFSKPSPKGVMVLLSLGEGKGSPYVASAVQRLGYDLVVVSAKFPRLESPYARYWAQQDPFGDYESLKERIRKIGPLAVLVEQRNILLPIKARLNLDLKLADYGQESHKSSNSKIELRQAIDNAGLPNIPWCLLDDYKPGEGIQFPFVIKPETGTGSRGITVCDSERDFDTAMRKLDELKDDETVGGRIFIEQAITGRQFDVEGVYLNGTCFPLSVTEEHYDVIEKALPSSWYLFSPPIEEALREKIVSSAKDFTRALGVRNGAFHCEMRVDENENIYAIDYSNRMGYPHLVSECCGYSFPESYVTVMAGIEPDFRDLQRNTVFQRFIRNTEELKSYQALMREHPELVIQKNMAGSYVGGVKTYARVALRHQEFDRLRELLDSYDLIPEQWRDYYNV